MIISVEIIKLSEVHVGYSKDWKCDLRVETTSSGFWATSGSSNVVSKPSLWEADVLLRARGFANQPELKPDLVGSSFDREHLALPTFPGELGLFVDPDEGRWSVVDGPARATSWSG
jgi:hypothetical protein